MCPGSLPPPAIFLPNLLQDPDSWGLLVFEVLMSVVVLWFGQMLLVGRERHLRQMAIAGMFLGWLAVIVGTVLMAVYYASWLATIQWERALRYHGCPISLYDVASAQAEARLEPWCRLGIVAVTSGWCCIIAGVVYVMYPQLRRHIAARAGRAP